MLLAHLFIAEHKYLRDINIPVNGSFACQVSDKSITLAKTDDTSQFYNNNYCSAIIGPNGIGKSTIMDFIELLVNDTDSRGVVIFYDHYDNEFHLCNINFPELSEKAIITSLPFHITSDSKNFIIRENINFIKLNNISDLNDALSFSKTRNSVNFHDLSLGKVTHSIADKKNYFEKLNKYFTESYSRDRFTDNVYYQFRFSKSPLSIAEKVFRIISKETYTSAFAWWSANRYDAALTPNDIERGKSGIFQKLLRLNALSILACLGEETVKDEMLLAPFFYRYMAIDNETDHNAASNYAIKLAIATQDDNRYSISQELKNTIGIHEEAQRKLFSTAETIKRKELLEEYIAIFDDIAEIIDDNCQGEYDPHITGVQIDDFDSIQKLISLLNSLPVQISNNFNWGWRGVSSGELARTHIFSQCYHYLTENSLSRPTIFLMDEVDLYLHPEWQRTFLSELTQLINLYKPGGENNNIQIILCTHSPIIVSDFMPADIVSLKRLSDDIYSFDYDQIITGPSVGFGNTIAEIYMSGMHLSSAYGELTKNKLQKLTHNAENDILSSNDIELISKTTNNNIKNFFFSHAKNK